MIPSYFFDGRKTVVTNLSICKKIEHFSKYVKYELKYYTNGKVKFNIIRATKKIKSLLKIKDDVQDLSCVIHQGIYSCRNNYVVETMRNTATRLDEHEQPNGKLEPSKHLKNNLGHIFGWMIFSSSYVHHLMINSTAKY